MNADEKEMKIENSNYSYQRSSAFIGGQIAFPTLHFSGQPSSKLRHNQE